MSVTAPRQPRTTANLGLPVPGDDVLPDVVTDLGNLADAIDSIVRDRLWTPGDIKASASQLSIPGWLICQGQAVSRTEYPDLFAAIGTLFGIGNGSTTFNVPNLQNRTIVGTSSSKALNASGGEETHALTLAELAAHGHGVAITSAATNTDHYHTFSGTSAAGGVNHTHGSGGIGMFATTDGSLEVANVWNNPQAGHTPGVFANRASPVSSTGGASAFSHTHAFSGNTSWQSQTYATNSHSHAVNGNTSNSGSNNAHNNMPPYVALNYFIKT